MQLLGERMTNGSEPEAFPGSDHPAGNRRLKPGRRRGARVRAGVFTGRRRRARRHWDTSSPNLPDPLLTEQMALDHDVITDAVEAATVAANVTANLLRSLGVDPDGENDDADTAEWEPDRAIRAIDLSDGPKLINHPEPPRPATPKPAPPKFPIPKPGPPPSAPPVSPAGPPAGLAPGSAGRPTPSAGSIAFDDDLGGTITRAIRGIPEQVARTDEIRSDVAITNPLAPIAPGSTQVPDPVQLATEPSKFPEAMLATVLSLVACLTAVGTSAPPSIWLPLAAIPVVGMVALLLPGTTSARVVRAGALLCVAAVLPVMSASMTPVTLVITLAAVASYPMLVEPEAGRLVTALAAASLALPLLVVSLQDGRGHPLFDPAGAANIEVELALSSGILVVALIGISTAATRRVLDATASVAVARERTARANAAAVGVASASDAATGLPNRAALLRAATLAMNSDGDQPTSSHVGVIQIDLDRFEALADSLGAGLADDVAEQIGHRLRETHTADQLIARIGRHQFALLVPQATDDTCARLARAIATCFDKPVRSGDQDLSVTCSMGAAICGPNLETADDLLQAADEAVRAAARTGRCGWQMFDQAVRDQLHTQATMEAELCDAVLRAKIEVEFQPVLALGAGDLDDRIVGTEVLARWTRYDGTVVEPLQFIPMADQLGLGLNLGMHVINRALAALVRWRHEGVEVDQVWVNLSPAQLNDPEFPHEVAAQLAIRGLATSCLVLEVSAAGLAESQQALATMSMLRALGIAVALDDFGRSGTSLSMLRRLPISAVKLDCTLAGQLGDDDEVPRAVAGLCRTLGLRVVVEGVETVTQLNGARDIQADAVQGFAIARPMSGEDITNLLTLRLPRDLRLR
jgi:diguanylate cyclase (GGDEF)-like protein